MVRTVVAVGAPSVDALRRAPAQAATLGLPPRRRRTGGAGRVGPRGALSAGGHAAPGGAGPRPAGGNRRLSPPWPRASARPTGAPHRGRRQRALEELSPRARRRRLPALSAPGRHGKREDRGVPARRGARARRGAGGAGAGAGDCPHPAAGGPLSQPLRERRWRCCTAASRPRAARATGRRCAAARYASRWACARRCSPRWRTWACLVVDEEHDPSFKQDEKLRYQARDLAVVRAKHVGAAVVLGSATPSLETCENARRGRYRACCELPARVDDRPLPTVELVDSARAARAPTSRTSPPALSPPLRRGAGETLGRGSRPSSSSTGAGHSRRCCARPAARASPASSATSSSPSTCRARTSSATTAAQASPCPRPCPACGGRCVAAGRGHRAGRGRGRRHAVPTARVARLDRDACAPPRG